MSFITKVDVIVLASYRIHERIGLNESLLLLHINYTKIKERKTF